MPRSWRGSGSIWCRPAAPRKLIAATGAAVRDISDLTGFPEMMDGRVKTLHPKVHGGLLAVRDNPTHKASMDEHGIGAIDLVVVNLYPFEATIAKGASYDETIENIDIGGPAMIRSAAKNHAYVTVVVDPNDYEPVLDAIRQDGGVPYRDAPEARGESLCAHRRL